MPKPSELRQTFKDFMRGLSSTQVNTCINDLLDLGVGLRSGGNGVCLAEIGLTLQVSPPRITAASNYFPGQSGLATDAEIVAQAGWAWLSGWFTSDGCPCRGTIESLKVPPNSMPVDAFDWAKRAIGIGSAFASVADARSAIPA